MADYYLYEEQYFMDYGIVLSELGSDSVVIENKDTQDIYICGHFKEFKIKKPRLYRRTKSKSKLMAKYKRSYREKRDKYT